MVKGLVSIIIVNWNGVKWLPDCFGSLAQQEWKSFEIIFVDNASNDESIAWVKRHYPETKIIKNSTNLGFSHANNIGYKHVRGEYILFLNNDTRVTKTFLTELVNVLKTDNLVGGVQSKILLMDKPDTLDSVGAFLTPTGFLYHYGFGKKDSAIYDKQIDLYTAKGACMIFRKDVLDSVAIEGNIFNPSYFAYFEETDMCHRIWLSGYRIVYAYKSVIRHKMGATSSSMNNAYIQYHSFKNRINSYILNLGPKELCKILPIHLSLCFCFAFLSFARFNFQLGWAVLRALWWNAKNIKKTLKTRKYIQDILRVQSDKKIFPKIMRYPGMSYYLSFM